ncbi:MAG: hypothetical protein JXB88_19740 [Spirochaetales bacterium]|nr:hypothetical protein [Spirochaetales bacterium]
MENKIVKNFSKWLDMILKKNKFDAVVAFNFNLYEGKGSFHIQLIGSDSFDRNDEDWACKEVYSSGENVFIVSRKNAGQEWQKGLSFCTGLVRNYLSYGEFSKKLKDKTAVGIGFVDGNIDIIYEHKQ